MLALWRDKPPLHARWVAVAAGVAVLLGAAAWEIRGFFPKGPGRPRWVVVSPGMSAAAVGKRLEQEGLVVSGWAFALTCQVLGESRRLQAGAYRLSPAMSPAAIAERLARGETSTLRLLVPPGARVAQVAAAAAAEGLASRRQLLALARSGRIGVPLPPPGPGVRYRLEGYLGPATYSFPPHVGARRLWATLVRTFDARVLTPRVRAALRRRGVSVREAVTLASLVEEEACLPADRRLVAAVFWNRLRRGMPLQSDATVRYALGRPASTLTVRSLRVPSPYNTYLHRGLPPGPIASPSRESLLAVLHPAKVPYLYFTARPDGSLVFSRTYAGQLRAQRRAWPAAPSRCPGVVAARRDR